MSKLVEWLESHQLPCTYKKFLGVECPTCGIQRSFIALLKGDLSESFMLFPGLIPLLLTFAILVSWILFKRPSFKIVKWSLIISFGLIFTDYVLKLLGIS